MVMECVYFQITFNHGSILTFRTKWLGWHTVHNRSPSWTGYGLRFIDKRRFDVHGDGSDNPAREKYCDGLGLFFTALEPK